jgi:hypothetical protein
MRSDWVCRLALLCVDAYILDLVVLLHKLGFCSKLVIKMPVQTLGVRRTVICTVEIGGTEHKGYAYDKSSGEEFEAQLHLPDHMLDGYGGGSGSGAASASVAGASSVDEEAQSDGDNGTLCFAQIVFNYLMVWNVYLHVFTTR